MTLCVLLEFGHESILSKGQQHIALGVWETCVILQHMPEPQQPSSNQTYTEIKSDKVLYDVTQNAVDALDFGFVKEQIHILLISIVNSEIRQWITEVLLTKFVYPLVSLRV